MVRTKIKDFAAVAVGSGVKCVSVPLSLFLLSISRAPLSSHEPTELLVNSKTYCLFDVIYHSHFLHKLELTTFV